MSTDMPGNAYMPMPTRAVNGMVFDMAGMANGTTPERPAPRPARAVSCRMHRLPSALLVAELFFDVPLDHDDPDGETIRLFARAAFLDERPIVPNGHTTAAAKNIDSAELLRTTFVEPWLAYCEGGPGFGNKEPQEYAWLRHMLVRGYQVLFLDYRGTGLSSPVSATSLMQRTTDPAAQAAYLKLFRADSIVRDLEAVRHFLTDWQPPARRAWSLLGQSFGGFVSLTYLSFYARGVREVFMTGGMAPVDVPAETVYRATFAKARERNRAYFAKYPEDVQTLRRIAVHLAHQQPTPGALALPGGGVLTMHRVLTFGYAFGFHGGLDQTHALLLRMNMDLERVGVLTRATLVAVETFFPLDTAPMYALVHEAIYAYGPGATPAWAAMRAGRTMPEFQWVDAEATPQIAPDQAGTQFMFSGEMIFPFMFDTFPELVAVRDAAHILAHETDWPPLYDAAQLARNTVPVYAATYIDDLYVDYELARATASRLGAVRMYTTNTLYHNALRARMEDVISNLLRLRDDTID